MKVEGIHTALEECRLHAQVLEEALSDLARRGSFTAERVLNLSKEERRLLDQMAYRFSKLQDSLGEKVLPALVELAEEPLPASATFAEKLNRLERLEAIPSAGEWKYLRELRNTIAHEYPEAPALRAAAVNRFTAGVPRLLAVWEQARRFVQRHTP